MKRYLVYFFGTEFDRVKIGRSSANLYMRQSRIQVGCPERIKLLGIIRCKDEVEMKSREKELHRQFKEFQTSGEWYRLTPEISAYIEDFAASGEDILDEDRRLGNADMREYQREYHNQRYQNDPEYRQRLCKNAKKTRENNREYDLKRKRDWYHNNKEKASERQREYRQRPEVKERNREYARKRYRRNHKVREYQREYRQRPEVKERLRVQAKQRKSSGEE